MHAATTANEALEAARVGDCYQCGKCSAGCPMGQAMDLLPNQVVRLAQMGRLERAMSSAAVWLCVSCQTCTARCPQQVDCAGVMDYCRQESARRGLANSAHAITQVFQQAFLANIRRNGRLNELELVAEFKTRGFLKSLSVPLLLKDALLAPKMMARGKLHLRGEKVRDREVVRRIFERCREAEKAAPAA